MISTMALCHIPTSYGILSKEDILCADLYFRLELIRKGTGGRSSFNGVICTVFGATGFVGPYLVNALGKCGTMLIIPYRGDYYKAQHMKVAGDLGQVLFHHFHLADEKSLAKVYFLYIFYDTTDK